MSFVSLTFLLFLPVVFLLYWVCRSARQQNLTLILASYFFYAWWDWRFCGLMMLSTLIDYTIGWRLGRTTRSLHRRLLLTASIIANLTVLGIFKYANFFIDNVHSVLEGLGWHLDPITLNVVLPVGISFYTFQTLSYTIDVYQEKLKPSHNLIDYLAFVSFFPQLVAGPIERATHLLPQFAGKRVFDTKSAKSGLKLMLYGAAKKILIADRLALIVNERFLDYDQHSGPSLMLAVICFAFQIYCDFSAYSDIARGTARLFSIQLMRNFDYPYFSRSLSEFWRRWHISLSSWFRDYVYIPLGGNRCSAVRKRLNLMVTFVLSGIWHGAAWTFILWGGVHGLFLCMRHSQKAELPAADVTVADFFRHWSKAILQIGSTFTIVCVGWLFFRAESLHQAVQIMGQIVTDLANWPAYTALFEQISSQLILKRSIILLISFVSLEWLFQSRECPLEVINRTPVVLRWTTYTVIIWGIVYLYPLTGSQDFIYFDF